MYTGVITSRTAAQAGACVTYAASRRRIATAKLLGIENRKWWIARAEGHCGRITVTVTTTTVLLCDGNDVSHSQVTYCMCYMFDHFVELAGWRLPGYSRRSRTTGTSLYRREWSSSRPQLLVGPPSGLPIPMPQTLQGCQLVQKIKRFQSTSSKQNAKL